MVFIYEKKVGSKSYYYLRASLRKGSKVLQKDIAYLGNDPKKIMERLDKLPSKYSKEIRKSYKTILKFIDSNYYQNKIKKSKIKINPFFEKKILEEVESCRLHWQQDFQKLDDATKQETFQNFLVEFAYNSTGIEGNTITLKEAENLLMENLTPKNKTLREIFDLKNTQTVFFDLLEKPNKKIDLDFFSSIHNELLKEIDSRKGFRDKEIKLRKTQFKATPTPYVITDLKILLEWYHKNEKKLHPLVLASIFHHKFEKIHPFFDGNGRTGRILINYILMQKKYPPVIITKKHRAQYLQNMNKADNSPLTKNEQKHYKNLVNFVSNELIENYWNNFL